MATAYSLIGLFRFMVTCIRHGRRVPRLYPALSSRCRDVAHTLVVLLTFSEPGGGGRAYGGGLRQT